MLGQHFSHSIPGQKEKLARAVNSRLACSRGRDNAIPGWINLINSYASFLRGDAPGEGHQDQRACGFMRRSAETPWSLADCSHMWQKSRHNNWGSLTLVAHTHDIAPRAPAPLLYSSSLLALPCSPCSGVNLRALIMHSALDDSLGEEVLSWRCVAQASWCISWRIPSVPSPLRRRKLELPGGRCCLPSGLVLHITDLDDCPLCSESLLAGWLSPSISCIEIRMEIWGYWPWHERGGRPDFLCIAENNPNKNASCFSGFFFFLAFNHLWWWQVTQSHGCALKGRGQPACGRNHAGGRKEGCTDDSCLGKAGTAVLHWAGHSRTAWSWARRHQQPLWVCLGSKQEVTRVGWREPPATSSAPASASAAHLPHTSCWGGCRRCCIDILGNCAETHTEYHD